jgi:hypothetical protein
MSAVSRSCQVVEDIRITLNAMSHPIALRRIDDL